MLNSKLNIKTLLMIGIMLLVVFVFNMNTVNAVTEENMKKVLDIIPDTVQLNISEVEYEKAENIVISNIKKELRKNNIKFYSNSEKIGLIDKTFNGIDIIVADAPAIYKGSINKITIKVQDNTAHKEKNIKLVYNNQNKYNSNDEQYVKALKITSPRYFIMSDSNIALQAQEAVKKYELATKQENKTLELMTEISNLQQSNDPEKEQKITKLYQQMDELNIEYSYYGNAQLEIIGDYYTNLINDKSITIKASTNEIGNDASGNTWTLGKGTYIGIFRNNILYDVREMGQELFLPVTEIPDNIATTVDEYMNYMNKYAEEQGQQERATKIEEGIKKLAGVNVPNGYTIYTNSGTEIYTILKLAKTNYTVTVIDDTTNIKLEAGENVVPKNTVLITKLEKDTSTISVVTRSLENVSNKFLTYDITLKSGNAEIQPSGKVKISIPIPTDFNRNKLSVYRIESNGDKTEYEVKIEGDYAIFETDHFSTYVLVEKTTEDTKTTETDKTDTTQTTTTTTKKKEKDPTPKTGTVNIIGYVLAMTTVAGAGIVALKKNLK